MNTKHSFLIESFIGLGSLLLIVSALGYYILNEPIRIVQAQDEVDPALEERYRQIMGM